MTSRILPLSGGEAPFRASHQTVTKPASGNAVSAVGMRLLPTDLADRLRADASDGGFCEAVCAAKPPILRLFCPTSQATWLVSGLALDGDTGFGMVDVNVGPSLTTFSLGELEILRIGLFFAVERDHHFLSELTLGEWNALAVHLGSIFAAEQWLRRNGAGALRAFLGDSSAGPAA